MESSSGARAAFLDRDGIINFDFGHVHKIDDFKFIPGVLAACRRLHEAGFKLIVVTNQAGIAKGYYDENTFNLLSQWMEDRFREAGCPLTAIYYCPHHPEGSVSPYNIQCHCRKPEPGMILRAIIEQGLDVANSFLVGDKQSDIDAAEAAGVGRRFLVTIEAIHNADCLAAPVCRSLREVVDIVLDTSSKLAVN